MNKLLLYGCFGILGLNTLIHSAEARPVSYPGGWTLMAMNNGKSNSVHWHYSPAANYSVGVKSQYMREDDYFLNSVQTNLLLKRWNKFGSQANLYFKSGVGVATKRSGDDNQDALAVFGGLAADWETRRWFVSYENHALLAGEIDNHITQKARLGVAPYVAEFGALHTWSMIEFEHDPESNEPFTVTPLVRFFKGPALLEAGYSSNQDILFNFVYRF